jgi:hypothetical protein
MKQLSPKRDAARFHSFGPFLPGIAQQNLNAFWNASEVIDITKVLREVGL